VSPSPSLEYFIATAHWLDALTPPLEKHLEHLAGTVKLLLARIRKPEQVPAQADALESAGTVEPTIDRGPHKPMPLWDAYETVKRWGSRPIIRLAAVLSAAVAVVLVAIFVLAGWPSGDDNRSLLLVPTPNDASPTVVPLKPTALSTPAPSGTTAGASGPSPTAAPISTLAPVERSPTVVWRFETGVSFSWGLVVVDGVVYMGSGDNYVYALDAATGQERWGFETGDDVEFAPTVVDGTIYVGSDDNCVYALDAATGQERWRFQTGGPVQSSPAVADREVYVGSGDNYVYALDAATGQERWRFETGYEGADVRLSSPAVADGVVYIGSGDNYLYALDGTTGELRWRREMYDDVSSPVVLEGLVYVGTWLRGIRALDAATGQERWASGESLSGSLAVDGGVVYIGSGPDGVYALDAATGEQRWHFQTGAWFSSPALADDVVCIGGHVIESNESYLYALDIATGQERWRFRMGGQVVSSPAAANRVVYVGSQDGYLYALDATTLEERWVPERPPESGP
jgi:outer membrane protein assembly factor BamB